MSRRTAPPMLRDCACPSSRHEHGTEQAYISDHCRCDPCRLAHNNARNRRRRRKGYGLDTSGRVDGCGSRRRMQALHVLGWSQRAIGEVSGVDPRSLYMVLSGRSARVSVARAAQIAAAYDELWDRTPPQDTHMERITYSRVVNAAAVHGWVGPLFWDDDEIDDPKARPRNPGRGNSRVIVDEVAVERIKHGLRVPVNKVEQRTAIAELAASGVRTKDIADRLGMGLSSAIRTRNRITAAERQTA